MPYRTSSWTLLRVRQGGPRRGASARVAVLVLPVLLGMLFSWKAVHDPQSWTYVCGLVFLVPVTAVWIFSLVTLRRTRVAFYVEGFVSAGWRSVAVSWNDVAGVRRKKQDAGAHPRGWIIETRSRDAVHLPGWLVEPDVDLAPLRDRGFELPRW